MKTQLERRPLLVALCALSIGLTSIPHPINLLFLVTLLATLRDLRSWTLITLFFAIGVLRSPTPPQILTERTYVDARARINSLPLEEQGVEVATAQTDHLNLRIRAPEALGIDYGDSWHVKGVAHPPSEASESSYKEANLQGWIQLDPSTAQLEQKGPPVANAGTAWRRDFAAFAKTTADQDQYDWLSAICFRAGNLGLEDQNELVQSGTFYLVAASGLHVYALTALGMALFAVVQLPKPWQVGLTAAVLLAYCLATGGHLTTVRAAVASVLFLLAPFARRQPDILTAFALAALAFILWIPQQVYSLGLHVSAAVVVAFALFVPRIEADRDNLPAYLSIRLRTAGLAFVAIFFVAQPILAFHTGKLLIGAYPINLLLAALMPVILGISLVAYAVHFVIFPVAKGLLVMAVLPLTEFVRWLVHATANLHLTFQVPVFSPYWLAVYYGLWLVVWKPRSLSP